MDFVKVEISAESRIDADKIMDSLLAKRLITGGQIIQAPARFLWKGEIVDMDYFTLTSFTLPQHKEAIRDEVKIASGEEIPMITFLSAEGNQELVDWITMTVL